MNKSYSCFSPFHMLHVLDYLKAKYSLPCQIMTLMEQFAFEFQLWFSKVILKCYYERPLGHHRLLSLDTETSRRIRRREKPFMFSLNQSSVKPTKVKTAVELLHHLPFLLLLIQGYVCSFICSDQLKYETSIID